MYILPILHMNSTKIDNQDKFKSIKVRIEVYNHIQLNKGNMSISDYLLDRLVKKESLEEKVKIVERDVKQLMKLAGERY